ncbi:DUF2164 domain-containing protein [Virgibacillus oceani]
MNQKFELSKEQKDEMVKKIQGFFQKERGEEIGNLASMILLDFITEEIAPVFYNFGVADSYTFMSEKLDDLFGIEK